VLLITPKAARGYSIIEFMIAITVSLVILGGLTTLFVNNSRARAEIERANVQVENGRYAIDLLSNDLWNAGYLAEFDPRSLATPAALPDPCATALATLRTALPLHIQGVDNAATTPTCVQDVRANTDILVIRRAATCVAGSANCANTGPYFQTTLCNDELQGPGPYFGLDTNTASLTLHQRKPAAQANGCGPIANLYRYITNVYFVANNDNAGDGVPTLKRAQLGPNGFTVVPLVEGIENLQVEYGIDLPTTDGTADAFTADPAGYPLTAGKTVVDNWRYVVAIKLHVLARTTDTSPGYTDTKSYTLGLNANGTSYVAGPFNDSYKRHAYESLVRLNNPAGRNLP